MSFKVNDLVVGKVIRIKPYAAFLQFEDGIEGLLHISEISDNFIRDIEKYVSVGDELRVKILIIDRINGFMRVSLKQVPEKEFYSTHINQKRQVPNIKDDDFKVLEDNLPRWIEETLKRAKDEGKND